MSAEGLRQAQEKMRAAGVAEVAIDVFSHYYGQLEAGRQGSIAEADISPVRDLPRLEGLEFSDEAVRSALAETVVIKLNGGLGTSMGVTGPKSALPVLDGLTFLDIIVRQILALRQRFDVPLPLVLMNSFRTRDESLELLQRYGSELPVDGVPLDFLQNREPKLRADDLTPVEWPADPELEWCPPGHGDIFVALVASGMLDTLRDKGFRYAFISNADNLGAIPDGRIAAWMAGHDVPFGMEVCRRTRSDRKGGHVAVRRSDGRLVLRDSAQVADGEDEFFQDTSRHTTFNTNNLWVSLDKLSEQLSDTPVLGLPMIVNRKTVDPSDSSSTPVIQLETAMGTAIETFSGAQAVLVDRARFKPVKTTDDLLVLRSDFYRLASDGTLEPSRDGDEPFVSLDPKHFKLLADFEQRFAHGVPSLAAADRLEVRGDVAFGKDITVTGEAELTAPADEPYTVPDGTHLGT